MGSEIVFLIGLPIAFLGCINFIFQESVGSIASDYYENVTCEYPNYNTGINATITTCSIIDHPDSYEDDKLEIIPSFQLWNFTVNGGFFSGGADWTWEASTPSADAPIGWINYLGDWLSSLFFRIGQLFLLVFVWVTFPVQVEGLFFMIYLTIPLAIFLGFGIYKGVSPFV